VCGAIFFTFLLIKYKLNLKGVTDENKANNSNTIRLDASVVLTAFAIWNYQRCSDVSDSEIKNCI